MDDTNFQNTKEFQEALIKARDEGRKEGLHDGQIKALHEATGRAHARLDNHEQRIRAQERISYALLGAVTILNVLPAIMKFVEVSGQ